MSDTPPARHKLTDGLHARRERHRQRPWPLRALTVLAGIALLAAGVAMIVLPGPALAVIPAALALLALEFAWAERALSKSIEQARAAKSKAKSTSGTQRLLLAAAVALAIGAAVVCALTGVAPPLHPIAH